ncbi:hypothetical protein KEM56_006389 [Ascosphaera pollenicola]|nr:hypothetical protein KEM56_006389 [Ascosphaera pollenicola]
MTTARSIAATHTHAHADEATLRTFHDWFKWYVLMKNSITPRELWSIYVEKQSPHDPDYPPPITRPKASEIKEGASHIRQLTPHELQQYQMLYQIYEDEKRERDEQVKALDELHSIMLRSVKDTPFVVLEEYKTCASLFEFLKTTYGPTKDTVSKEFVDLCRNSHRILDMDERCGRWLDLAKHWETFPCSSNRDVRYFFRMDQEIVDARWAYGLEDMEKKDNKTAYEMIMETRDFYRRMRLLEARFEAESLEDQVNGSLPII